MADTAKNTWSIKQQFEHKIDYRQKYERKMGQKERARYTPMNAFPVCHFSA